MTMTTTSSENLITTTDTLVWCIILTKPRTRDAVVKRLEQWFAEREGATLLYEGFSEKQGQGVLLLELADADDDYGWFANALDQEKHVTDYTFYLENGPDDDEEEEG